MTFDTLAVSAPRHGSFLRAVLVADAALCVGAGAAFVVAADPLARLFGAPETAIAAVGAVLLAVAAGLFWLSRRASIPQRLVRALIVADLVWVADTIGITALGWIVPTTTGVIVILVQGGVVLGFAAAKAVALRRGA